MTLNLAEKSILAMIMLQQTTNLRSENKNGIETWFSMMWKFLNKSKLRNLFDASGSSHK